MLFAFVPMALAGFFLVVAFNDQIFFLYGVAAFMATIGLFMAYVAYLSDGWRKRAGSFLVGGKR